MIYMGSKARIAKHILPIILKDRKPGQWYVEPFVGGANIIDKVDGLRLGADSHPYLILRLKAMQTGWMPPEIITEHDYNAIKSDPNAYPPELVGYVGFSLSFGAKWFGGWGRCRRGDDYVGQALRNHIKQVPLIQDVLFVHSHYQELGIPPQSIVYCDPPYAGTTKYKDDFHHGNFWRWCDKIIEDGHTVFVSEYAAPDHWKCVWEGAICNNLKADNFSPTRERLFTRQT